MRRLLLLLGITALASNCYSQIVFEKGYFINNSDQRIECLIKNVDWQNNPREFEYKLEDAKITTTNISLVKEFGIDNVSKYKRYTVNIDRSGTDLLKMSTGKNPVFQEEELFLKVLVEGEASLYRFIDKGLERFFYKMNDSEITQLVYKLYMASPNQKAENNHFRQQLLIELSGPDLLENDFKNLHYETKELVRLFVRYNDLANSGYTNFREKEKRDAFNLTLRPGMNYSSLSAINIDNYSMNADYGNKAGFRFGIESEFILPFNKNKWAVIIEPSYQYYKSEIQGTVENVYADYISVELPVGLRYYFFLNKNSKIFVNGSMILDFPVDSKLRANYWQEFDIDSSPNVTIGFGYKGLERYSVELRYQMPRELLNGFLLWESDYNTLSVIFGYSIF